MESSYRALNYVAFPTLRHMLYLSICTQLSVQRVVDAVYPVTVKDYLDCKRTCIVLEKLNLKGELTSPKNVAWRSLRRVDDWYCGGQYDGYF